MRPEKKKTKGEEIKEAIELARKAGMLDANQHRFKFGNVEIERVSGIIVKNPTTGKRTIWLKNNGDAFFGKDIDTPEDVSLIVFSNDQEYNDEDVGAGDLLLGDNSTGKANLLWDRSTGQLLFRGGQSSTVFIDTDGGIYIVGGTNLSASQNYLHFLNPSDMEDLARMAAYRQTNPAYNHDFTIETLASNDDFKDTNLTLKSVGRIILDAADATVYIQDTLAITDGFNAAAVPTGEGYAVIYVDSADGDLKVKFSDGVVKTLATDT